MSMTTEEIAIVHQSLSLIDILAERDPNLKPHCVQVSQDIRKLLMRHALRQFMNETPHQDQGRMEPGRAEPGMFRVVST